MEKAILFITSTTVVAQCVSLPMPCDFLYIETKMEKAFYNFITSTTTNNVNM